VRYINKSKEPENFKAWKKLANDDWKPCWKGFSKPEKIDVHNALLQEQGFICCYCGMRINREASHIEHLLPRAIYPELALDYNNLLASCQGESEESPKLPVHCGHKKGKWHLMVSPLQANCSDFFKYNGAGEILAKEDLDKQSAAETTIDKLGLNIPKLTAMRREAIDAILLDIEELTEAEIQQLAVGYAQPDANGQYTPFCFAIAYILNQYFIT
jgi:uncharacterized protein (TIGR02646 family)